MKFSDIPGHANLKETLRQQIDNGKLPHALMLSGPSGIGKMMLARALAQYIHCENRQEGEACGECTSCRLHKEDRHPDLHYIYPVVKNRTKHILTSADVADVWLKMLKEYPAMPFERWLELLDAGNSQPHIHVEEADEIVKADSFPPISAEKKIFLVWLPEKMNTETANKILKVLEEPSQSTAFIFVSDNDLELLPTIFSRVRRYGVSPLSQSEIEQYLRQRYHFPAARAMEYGQLCAGSLIRADEFGAHTGEGDEFLALYQEIMRAAYSKRVAKLRQLADSAAGFGREKLKRMLNYMARMLRENFIYNMRMPQLNMLTREEESFSVKFAPFVNHLNIEDFMSETDKARRDIESNCNARLVLFDYFLYCIIFLHRKPTKSTK